MIRFLGLLVLIGTVRAVMVYFYAWRARHDG